MKSKPALDLRKTGISVVGDVRWGTHFCYFYETKQDLLDILVPYFKAGLESKEFCLWIISNSELITTEEAKEALRRAVSDLDRYLAQGSIEIVPHDEWFLYEGVFDFHRVANRFKTRLDKALANGFVGMRVNGSPAWIQDANVLREFEEEVNHLFPHERIIASCTYPLERSRADFVLNVARNHQFTLARRQGNWEVLETPELLQAKQEIRKLNEELEQRIIERTDELVATNEALISEIDQRRRAEQELRKRAADLTEAQRVAKIGNWVLDTGTDKVIWSEELYRIFEVEQEDIDCSYKSFVSRIHPDDQQRVIETNAQTRIEGSPFDIEYRIITPNDEVRVIREVGYADQDGSGNVIRLFGTAQDITDRKLIEWVLDERLRFETLVTELSAAFANLLPNEVDREIDKWLKSLVEFMSVDRASFFQFAEDWTTLYRSHSYTVPGIEPLPPRPFALKDQFPWISDQLRRGVTLKWSRVPDEMPEEAAKEKEYAAGLGIKSSLSIPIVMGGSVICAITFTSIVTYRDWPDTMVARLRIVGEIFAAAIERKRAEALLHAKEQEFRAIVENAPDHIARYDRSFRRTYVNPAFAKAFDLPAEALIGKPILSSLREAGLKEDELAKIRQRFENVFDTGKSSEFEVTVPMPKGQKYFNVRFFPEFDLNGSVMNVLAIARDITERRMAEEELKKEKEILKKIFDSIPVMIGFVGDDGVKLVNPEWERTIGWTLKELREQDVDIFVEAYPDPSYRQEVLNFVAASTGEWVDLKIKVRDGRIIDAACAVVHLSDGTRVAIAQDITERKQAEEALRRSEDQLRLVIDTMPTMAWTVRPDGVVDFVNQRWLDYTGLTWDEYLQDVHAVIHPEDKPTVIEKWLSAMAAGESYEAEMRLRRADGDYRWFLVRVAPLRDKKGNLIKWYGISIDIEDRKQAEALVHAKDQEFRAIVENAPDQIIRYDREFRRTYVNPAVAREYGLPLEALTDKPVGSVIRDARLNVQERELAQLKERIAAVFDTGKSSEYEMTWPSPRGRRCYSVRYFPEVDLDGSVIAVLGISRDITERKQTEDSLREALLEINALKDQLYQENVALREEIISTSMFEDIVGTSPVLQDVLALVGKVAPTDSTVLITGETGTGKELIARAIHKKSSRAARVFVTVHCAAIPTSLIASELFGHEKGAFTGAVQQRLGRFELAEGGTIFLDEIGELPPETQIALLRVLQENEFERVGGTKTIRANVRVIAATNRDLNAAIETGAFRSDLFYRLNVFPIEVPSLRERKEDIPSLVEYFVNRFANKMGKKMRRINKGTLDMLASYDWPGNIRELQNVIERSMILSEAENFTVDKSWLSHKTRPTHRGKALTDNLIIHQKEMIEAALAESQGRVSGRSGAAAILGIPPSTLDSKIKALKINKHRFKTS